MSIPMTPRNLPTLASLPDDNNNPNPLYLATRLGQALTEWSHRRADAPETAIDDLADLIAESSRPDEVERALLVLAKRVAGPGVRDVQLVRPNNSESLVSVPHPGSVVEVPLRFGGKDYGAIRIVFDGPHQFSPARHRRLTTLGILGAAMERPTTSTATVGTAGKRGADATSTHDATTGLPNSAFLTAFLAYALRMAERRGEPLSILYIGVDRLTAIRTLHGFAFADQALRKVARMVAGTLRTSDLIARLDDGRLVAILPGASAENALKLAETVREAVATAGVATPSMPVLTASIGVATFPEQAGESISLRAAAAAALADARAKGHDRVIAASPPDPDETVILHLADAEA